jgi:glycosyl hydrolase family 47
MSLINSRIGYLIAHSTCRMPDPRVSNSFIFSSNKTTPTRLIWTKKFKTWQVTGWSVTVMFRRCHFRKWPLPCLCSTLRYIPSSTTRWMFESPILSDANSIVKKLMQPFFYGSLIQVPKMKLILRRKEVFSLGVLILVVLFFSKTWPRRPKNVIVIPSALISHKDNPSRESLAEASRGSPFDWSKVIPKYPVTSMISLPRAMKGSIPKIQSAFKRETRDERRVWTARLDAVKSNFTHAWRGYQAHAWLQDEVTPISGQSLDAFGG